MYVFYGLGQQVPLIDLLLLMVGVAAQFYQVHSVQQWCLYGMRRVGRADEQHLAQIDCEIEVVVGEVLVLLGVEDLEQVGLRVAVHLGSAELIDLIQ